jgi:hypothetical protein
MECAAATCTIFGIYNAMHAMFHLQKRSIEYMTNTSDVIRQVETTLNDTKYPPTLTQKEILTMILYQVNTGTVGQGGYR